MAQIGPSCRGHALRSLEKRIGGILSPGLSIVGIMLLFLANLILVAHALIVAFIVLGLAMILLGRLTGWGSVRNWWFRTVHLAAICFVMAEAWLGLVCPLTEWENRLRSTAGETAYTESFIQHWLHKILFYDFAPWVFTTAYTAFAVLVLVTWLLVPPERRRKK